MSTKCLVTKLQGVVDNAELPVFDSFKITVDSGEFQFNIRSSGVNTLTFDNTVDDIYVGPNIVQSGWRSIANTSVRVHGTLTKQTTFLIDNVYSTTRFVLDNGLYRNIQCPSFKYMPITNITVEQACTCIPLHLELPSTTTTFSVKGSDTNRAGEGFDLDSCVPNTNMTFFRCFNSKAKGNISVFNNAINLDEFAVQRNPEVGGTIESFVEHQIANGREVGMANLDLRYTSVTMNSRTIESYTPNEAFKLKMTQTGCDICTYTAETVVASYNSSTGVWTYSS